MVIQNRNQIKVDYLINSVCLFIFFMFSYTRFDKYSVCFNKCFTQNTALVDSRTVVYNEDEKTKGDSSASDEGVQFFFTFVGRKI